MDISVIVPIHNSRHFLSDLVKSLTNQDYRGSYEIIFVDDGSTDGTDTLMKSLAGNVSNIRQKKSGPATARNLGIRHSRGRILAFTDSDCIPNRNWLSELDRAFKGGVSAVEGKVVTKGRIYSDSHFISSNGGMFLTSNIAFLRRSIRGFDERYQYPNREDSDIAFGILSGGKTIVFTKKAVVRHRLLKSSLFGMLKRKLYFESDVLLFKKYPYLYRKYIRFPFERFTPLYIIFSVAGFINPLLWIGIPLTAAAEVKYRKYKFSAVSYIKFLIAQAVGSFLNLFAVVTGCVRYRVNPIRLIL
ncbi:MAG: glycosyl transferase family protein [archaeon GW2011_AR5]|nr:MAG: glycosyl transferase family protein [archaeon GW2011_AR5]